jgi:hypothetical protein
MGSCGYVCIYTGSKSAQSQGASRGAVAVCRTAVIARPPLPGGPQPRLDRSRAWRPATLHRGIRFIKVTVWRLGFGQAFSASLLHLTMVLAFEIPISDQLAHHLWLLHHFPYIWQFLSSSSHHDVFLSTLDLHTLVPKPSSLQG